MKTGDDLIVFARRRRDGVFFRLGVYAPKFLLPTRRSLRLTSQRTGLVFLLLIIFNKAQNISRSICKEIAYSVHIAVPSPRRVAETLVVV